MLANASPLIILDYAITKMDFSLVAITKETEDLIDTFSKYEVDIDFDIYKSKALRVVISAKINQGKLKKPGYSICAEVGCFFKFDDNISKTLSDQQRNEIEGFSTVYMALNTLRGLISSFTANAPYGRYILPSIDLNKLIDEKRKTVLVEQQEKPKKSIIKKSISNEQTKQSNKSKMKK